MSTSQNSVHNNNNNNNNLFRKNAIKIFTMTWNKIQVHILLIFYKEEAY